MGNVCGDLVYVICFPPNMRANKYRDSSDRGMLRNAEHKSVTVKNFTSGGTLVSNVFGFGTSDIFGHIMGVLHGLCVSSGTPASNKPEIVLLIPSSASGFSGYCGHLGSFVFGFSVIVTVTGLADFTKPTSISLLDQRSSCGLTCLPLNCPSPGPGTLYVCLISLRIFSEFLTTRL